MRLQVLLFAQLADEIGVDRLEVEQPADATVGDLMEELARRHEPIAVMRGTIAVAVDERYQPSSARLADRCTVALIPPVSGG
jgi:molybdopterin converting factor subunit 1